MKIIYLLLFILLGNGIDAQTWNGTVSSNWNTPTNWTPNLVPTAASTVNIPIISGPNNNPMLTSDILVNTLNMSAGSKLDVNGFAITTGNCDFNGAMLNNTNVVTDIILTVTGAGATYFRNNTINDNITINYNGTSEFYEGFTGGNIYNGNSIYNAGGTGTLALSYDNRSTFNGNVTVTRTVVGSSEIFRYGAVTVNGNFTYTNNIGGNTLINVNGGPVVPITGTINITTSQVGTPLEQFYKLKNQTSGGTISIQNSGLVQIYNDTLLMTAINITGFVSGGNSDLLGNILTGSVTIADGATNTGGLWIRNNTINGNTSCTVNGTGILYEGYTAGNTYNGNTIFNFSSIAAGYICYSNKSTFNGNLTVNRTIAGTTNICTYGATAINGNFSYTNNIGGNTYINQAGPVVNISGTVNISSNPVGNPTFYIYNLKNQTTGGTVSIQNSGLVQIYYDTLLLSALNVIGFASGGVNDFYQNILTCNVTITEGATNNNYSYFRKNTINGNTIYTQNTVNTLFEGYQGVNTYNGNATFIVAGTGTIYLCYDSKCTYNGNLSVTRSGAGISYIFNAGANAVTGNFSYTNNVGGATNLNSGNSVQVPISGMINVSANALSGHPLFYLDKIMNQTTGGTISVQNSGRVEMYNDTILVNALNVNGILSGGTSDFSQNLITGTVNISDSTGDAGTYFRRNTINGNMTYTQNATSTLYEAYQGANTYIGNLTLVRNAGTISMAYDNPTFIQQDLTLNSASGIVFTQPVHFSSANNGIVRQLGTQPIMIPTLVMEKTGSGKITLNDSVTVTTTATFNGGNIYTGAASNLIFLENVSFTNASTSSHVIGPVTKIGDNAFTFPVGSPVSYNPVSMSAPVGLTTKFKGEYKYQNPTIDGYNTSSKAGTLGIVSNAAYWNVQRLVGVTNVNLTFSFLTNPYEQYPVLANLKVAHWNGAQWDDLGNGGTTGTSAAGTIVNSASITSFSPFTIAGVTPTYFFTYGNPGPGPDGSPLKFGGAGGYPPYNVKLLPVGTYTADSIFLVANASTNSFRLKDNLGVEKDTSVTAPTAPTTYISANGNGTVNFKGWRYFVYMRDGSNNIMGAVKDNDLTLGNVTMNTYFSTAAVATSPNGNLYLKRSFRIQSQFAPIGTRRVRFYITKQEFNDLQAADPSSLPDINSLTITKYTGPLEDSLFNPVPGGNAIIIPNSAITKVDLGTMWSLDVDVSGFSGFYIGGNQSSLNLCPGSTISLTSNISGATYQWQLDAGSGFNNISDGGVYSGSGTSSLTITSIPSSYYGYKYRCVVNGGSFSQIYTLKFAMIWQGTVSSAWENAANWSCGLPDVNTDVIINPGKPNYPLVSSNQSIRTLKLSPGTAVTVGTGFNLNVTK